MTECEECEAGKVSTEERKECMLCEPGRYSGVGEAAVSDSEVNDECPECKNKCPKCDIGRYTNEKGKISLLSPFHCTDLLR